MNRPLIGVSARACAALALCLSSLSLAACSNEPTPPVEPAPLAPPPPASPPGAAAPNPASAPVATPEEPEPTADELPIADDFAVEAEQQIDAKSYRAELDALDKEISSEPAP